MSVPSQPSSMFAAACLYLLVVFVGRSILQYVRTGGFGFHGIRAAAGTLAWWAGCGVPLAVVGLVCAPALASFDLLGRDSMILTVLPPSWLRLPLGWALFVLGFLLTVVAQLQMGDAWRIGVREDERTTLKSEGLFAWCRNPIFTGMLVTTFAIVLWLPGVVTITCWVVLWLSLEVQVRLVEEPHLLRVHGSEYSEYAKQTGRFLPRVGKLDAKTRRRPRAASPGS